MQLVDRSERGEKCGAMRSHFLMLVALISTLHNAKAAPVAEELDSDLTPTIQRLLETSKFLEACSLHANLAKLSQLQQTSRGQQLKATMQLIQDGLRSKGAKECNVTTPDGFTLGPIIEDDDDANLEQKKELLAEEEQQPAFPNAEAVMESANKLCENCEMDYAAEETKQFSESFAKDQSKASPSATAAKSKLTKIAIWTFVSAVGLIVATTLGLFFGIRACIKMRKKKTALPSISSSSPTGQGPNASVH